MHGCMRYTLLVIPSGFRSTGPLRVAIRRVFFARWIMNRVSFLIDGFNLYHSVRDAGRTLGGAGTKWLDIRALCTSSLHLVGNGAAVEGIYYFSALANHLTPFDPSVVSRHQDFIDCLDDTGVQIELSRFKPRTVWCPHCGKQILRHEEKETDVALATKLMELFLADQCETAVLVTGDTDLAPVVRTVKRLFPAANVLFAFPFGRKNKELQQLAPRSFKFSRLSYVNNQFADPYVTTDGRSIAKPLAW